MRLPKIRTHSDRPGVSALRLGSQGYGESMPMVDESMEEGWEKNRRVDFLIDEREDLKR